MQGEGGAATAGTTDALMQHENPYAQWSQSYRSYRMQQNPQFGMKKVLQ